MAPPFISHGHRDVAVSRDENDRDCDIRRRAFSLQVKPLWPSATFGPIFLFSCAK
jgi:hypothetical protein